ncbi:hypothetical protein H8K32_02225 [Undibacterium jejuense]|uniref:Lipoprotein n=1 Tax=Undibacterium jejuense TaxID=1344949 RepID=A0A923HAN3_9BURK|nr:hypothetical protein [Undibacterium jejuense]MBC3860902.1 hypothetical protein [Undibacterium jejuense]
MIKVKTLMLSSLVGLVIAGCGGSSNAPIGGTLTGLAGGSTLTLLNNNANPLTLGANGFFTFSLYLPSGSGYNVTVNSQPIGQTCSVTNGTGTVSSNGAAVTNVAVNCVANLPNNNIVFGNLTGLPAGKQVVLTNAQDTLTLTVNGAFAFPTAVPIGGSYLVSLKSQSPGLNCTTANVSGTIPATGFITQVVVSC